jgi:hypothetical protein
MRRDPKQDIGKRSIHFISGTAGVIKESVEDGPNDFENVVRLDTGAAGHRHYFYIEGDKTPGGQLFEENKAKYFAE